jgi:hypothetical protein
MLFCVLFGTRGEFILVVLFRSAGLFLCTTTTTT